MLTRDDLTDEEDHALHSLMDGTSGDMLVEQEFLLAFLTGLRVFKERQKKYGRANIARAGAAGVVIRLGDKLSRLERQSEVTDESVNDTWIDVSNYNFIRLMAENGRWPK